jgi:hypothetical protein
LTAPAANAVGSPLTPPEELYVAARQAAGRLEREMPHRCAKWRVEVSGVADDLGVVLCNRRGMTGRARWHRRRALETGTTSLWSQAAPEVDVIDVRADLRTSTRRFAIAHEIGHVILHRHFAPLATHLTPAHQERFANAFAAELLLARTCRGELVEQFRAAQEPVGLLRLVDSLGVSPQTVLRFARRENWLEGLNRVWLDIRVLNNRHTGQDRRPRVYDAVLDRGRWFLPRNRSVAGAFGSDAWLANADIQTCHAEASMHISHRREGSGPTYVRRLVPARLAAIRLGRTTARNAMEFLVSAQLLASDGVPGDHSAPPCGEQAQIALF